MKKKSHVILMVIALIISSVSCASENVLEEVSKNENSITNEKIKLMQYSIDSETAAAILDEMMSVFDNTETRSFTKRQISSIEQVKSNINTRSNANIPEVLFYVINYANEGGFGIMGADKRLLSMYAISPTGNLSLSDTLTNDNFAYYLSTLKTRVENELVMSDIIIEKRDSIELPDPCPNPNNEQKILVSPLLPLKLQRWHQLQPFNEFVSNGYPAGCTVLSVATMMGYYKYPKILEGIQYDWDAICNDYYNTNIGKLIITLHKSKYLDAYPQKNPWGTAASDSNIPDCLRQCGYRVANKTTNFNEVDSDLKNGMPIIIAGSNNEYGGHCWIIDGLLTVSGGLVQSPENPEGIANYYHSIWGWGGSNNGYFYYSDGYTYLYPYFKESYDYGGKLDAPYNNYRCYTNICPKNR